VQSWRAFFGQLFVKYMDGNVKTQDDATQLLPTVSQPGYSLAWRDRIVAETDSRFRVPEGNVGLGENRKDGKAKDPMARDVAVVERGRQEPHGRRRPRWKGM
jgi:hypothetical protein